MQFVVGSQFVRNALFLSLLLSLLAVGCGIPHPESHRSQRGDLVLEVWVDRHWVNVGGTVNIRFTVENFGQESKVFELKDQSVMDIRVHFQRLDGTRVYAYWCESQPLTSEMRRLELGPGESKSITMQWVAPEEADTLTVDIGGILRESEKEDRWHGTGLSICVGTSEGACYP